MSALPTKYVPVGYSLLGVASFLAEQLRENDTVSTLWDRVRDDPRVRTFDRYAEALTRTSRRDCLTLIAPFMV
jgi:hypothetical protein